MEIGTPRNKSWKYTMPDSFHMVYMLVVCFSVCLVLTRLFWGFSWPNSSSLLDIFKRGTEGGSWKQNHSCCDLFKCLTKAPIVALENCLAQHVYIFISWTATMRKPQNVKVVLPPVIFLGETVLAMRTQQIISKGLCLSGTLHCMIIGGHFLEITQKNIRNELLCWLLNVAQKW